MRVVYFRRLRLTPKSVHFLVVYAAVDRSRDLETQFGTVSGELSVSDWWVRISLGSDKMGEAVNPKAYPLADAKVRSQSYCYSDTPCESCEFTAAAPDARCACSFLRLFSISFSRPQITGNSERGPMKVSCSAHKLGGQGFHCYCLGVCGDSWQFHRCSLELFKVESVCRSHKDPESWDLGVRGDGC